METIGKYHVQRVLGHGGMGTVYEALDPVLNRKVAIKIMTPGLADAPELRLRFLREAQAAGGLRHRNIVTVYDLGDDRGEPYIAMEFIEGTDLEKIIQKKEPLSVERKLDVIRQICEGLGYAHRAGIVHRDVKPANIRLTPEGEVKIMDFGIAHLQSSTMTKSGLVLGTVHYMAPEQIQGRKVDHRADIFAVGAIAYELIAYRRAFEGDSLTNVMFKIMHEPADPTRLPASDYTPGLEGIVLRALARDPGERYPSLDEMRADLERLVRETAPRLLERAAPRDVPETQVMPALARPPEEPKNAAEARRRPRTDVASVRARMESARAEGQLPKALVHARRLLELDPEDPALREAAAEIEAAIQEKELEQLCEMALSYAAEGDIELAATIAGRIERMAPESARYRQLHAYLNEETARRRAKLLTAQAGDQLADGDLEAALASAEQALAAYPSNHAAREICERVTRILVAQGKRPASVAATPDPTPETAPADAPVAESPGSAASAAAFSAAEALRSSTPPPYPSPTQGGGEFERPRAVRPPPHPSPTQGGGEFGDRSRATEPEFTSGEVLDEERAEARTPGKEPAPVAAAPAPDLLTPLPEGSPENPDAAVLVETARRLLRDRDPQKALPLLEQAVGIEPTHAGLLRLLTLTRGEARRAQIESLTTAALEHFVHNEHRKAQAAVEQALALDPKNRKALELRTILGALG